MLPWENFGFVHCWRLKYNLLQSGEKNGGSLVYFGVPLCLSEMHEGGQIPLSNPKGGHGPPGPPFPTPVLLVHLHNTITVANCLVVVLK